MGKSSFVRGKNDGRELVAHVARPDLPVPDIVLDFTSMQDAVDIPDLLAGLARSVVNALSADACLVSLVDEDQNTLRDVAASVVSPVRLSTVAEEYKLSDYPVTKWVIDTGQWVEISVSDARSDAAERDFLKQLGFARVLITRFTVEGEVKGTIEVYRMLDLPFRKDATRQIDVLSSFAANIHTRLQLADSLEMSYTKTMEALVSALEARDPYTEAHAGRITELAMALSVAMQLSGEHRRAVKLGSILHDVGKIGIPDAILGKPGELTDEEWQVMRTHAIVGEKMLRGVDFLGPALPVIRHHHERWDGTGYPDGIGGGDIPIGARIVAVCDSFDAMTSDRPYRRAMSIQDAFGELLSCAGTQFDPKCAALLVDVVSHMGEQHLEERFVRYAS
jgi:HD-GYP domain-containing protein (c-di-GMP phosphodiesterase class II)